MSGGGGKEGWTEKKEKEKGEKVVVNGISRSNKETYPSRVLGVVSVVGKVAVSRRNTSSEYRGATCNIATDITD